MSEFDEIRNLLSALEQKLEASAEDPVLRNLDALEFPDLVAAIADFLQPQLTPYEAAIYWHLFRRAIIATGTQYVRASTRGLAAGVVRSASGQSQNLSYSSVQTALQGLESKQAIFKSGDTNREGTLYKICLPEEIPICLEMMKQSVSASEKPVNEEKELDFYNVTENREKVFERDSYECYYCKKQLTRFTATLDHIQPVSTGGDNSFENLVTSCLHCNSRRGNRPVMDAIIDQDPDTD